MKVITTGKAFFLMILALFLLLLISPFIFIINLFLQDNKKYFFAIAIGLDQLGGSILYCQPDWTVSSWTYYLSTYKKSKHARYFMYLIDFLFGKDHCKRSFEWESKYNIIPKDEDWLLKS